MHRRTHESLRECMYVCTALPIFLSIRLSIHNVVPQMLNDLTSLLSASVAKPFVSEH